MSLSHKLLDHVSSVTTVTETVTTPDTGGLVLIASGATFITDEVQVGAVVVNTTDGSSYGYVKSVDSETQLTLMNRLVGGTNQDFGNGDSVTVSGSRVIFPQTLRDQQGYVQVVRHVSADIVSFNLRVEAKLAPGPVTPWTRLIDITTANTNLFSNWTADPDNAADQVALSIAIPIWQEMRVHMSAIVPGASGSVSAWIVE